MANKNRQRNREEKTEGRAMKVFALITYCIALAALLLGLLLPYGVNAAANGTTDAMWVMQLPQALKAAIPVQSFQDLIGDAGAPFTFSLLITVNGWLVTDTLPNGYDLGALFTVLYALVALAGLIGLIPAIAGTLSKKSTSNTPLKTASFIEVVALAFVSIFVLIQLTQFTLVDSDALTAAGYQWSWALLASFGGILLMLIVQSFISKKGSGIIKFVLMLFSAITLLFAVYDVGAVIPPLKEPLQSLYDATSGTFGGGVYSSVIGITPVLMFFCGVSPATLTEIIADLTAIDKTLVILTLILSLLAIINFILDAMGLGKTTKKFMLVSNIVRYTLTLITAALVIMMPLFIEGQSIGLMAIIIAFFALVALIINIIRFAKFGSAKKSRAKKVKYTEYTEETTTNAEAVSVTDKKAEKQARKEAEKQAKLDAMQAEKEAKREQQAEKPAEKKEPPAIVVTTEKKPVEKKENKPAKSDALYNGPVDGFILTLSNDERMEFKNVFLDRRYGQLSFIPEYTVGGNNLRFFNSVFIYYSRIREGMSESLLNKMYKYCGMM